MRRILAAVVLLALAGCGDDEDGGWCGMPWLSNGYATEGDVLEVVDRAEWVGNKPCGIEGTAYSVTLFKLSGSEPRDVHLVGESPFPYNGRVRVAAEPCECGTRVIRD